MNQESMLEEAVRVIYGDRESDYGSVTENFERIAHRWSQQLGVGVTARQVALCMIELKMARLAQNQHHRDSLVDVAGYVGCIDKLERGE